MSIASGSWRDGGPSHGIQRDDADTFVLLTHKDGADVIRRE